MDLEWTKLRTWNGSQHLAFEELCTQLARAERPTGGREFVRNGRPDGGVECYWRLDSGGEWAIQAKYFLSPPNDTQWAEITESVKRALTKHPATRRITICIPQDRQDPRIEHQQWFMDRWLSKVREWTEYASSIGLSVEFDYWGTSEIGDSLSQSRHAGRLHFWFGTESLGLEWFAEQVNRERQDIGDAAFAPVSIQVPANTVLAGLAVADSFIKEFRDAVEQVLLATTRLSRRHLGFAPETLREIEEATAPLAPMAAGAFDGIDRIPELPQCASLARAINTRLREYVERLDDEVDRMRLALAALDLASDERSNVSNELDDLQRRRSAMWSLRGALSDLATFCESAAAQAATKRLLLIHGQAGTGKTFLLTEAARLRCEQGIPTILLMGSKFNASEPWTRAVTELRLHSITPDELLGALNAAAEASGHRLLVLLDGINEGDGSKVWPSRLNSMADILLRYENLALAITIRSPFESAVLPEPLHEDFVQINHVGFAEIEQEAAAAYFGYYGVTLPAVPVVMPEFSNPLFLSLFARSLEANRSAGYPGSASALFAFFERAVQRRLAKALDLDPNGHDVTDALRRFAGALPLTGSRAVSVDVARIAVNGTRQSQGYNATMLAGLLSEGVLREFPIRSRDGIHQRFVSFSFERMADFTIAERHLAELQDTEALRAAWRTGGIFETLLVHPSHGYADSGLLQALSSLAPERFGVELYEMLPIRWRLSPAFISAFLDSLIWRDPENVTPSATRLLEWLLHNGRAVDAIWESLLTVAVKEAHPHNAEYVHQLLLRQSMTIRDYVWSTWLHEQYGQHGAADRLLDWILRHATAEQLDRMTAPLRRLCGLSLAWFFTSSHRFQRDRATKALVRLFTHRLSELTEVVTAFNGIDDPYVTERILAAAYGSALRSAPDDPRPLAIEIQKQIFSPEAGAYPHVLARDYARGVLEVASRYGDLPFDRSSWTPPYRSDWPALKVRSARELRRRYGWYRAKRNEVSPYAQIFHSTVSDGDFARYEIDSHLSFLDLSSRKRGKRHRPTPAARKRAFLEQLSESKRQLLEECLSAYQAYERNIFLTSRLWAHDRADASSSEAAKQEFEQRSRALEESLTQRELKTLKSLWAVLTGSQRDDKPFDTGFGRRWVFERTLQLGWAPELFGEFDRWVGYGRWGREARKPERIGKKYQWIALHELTARALDNFEPLDPPLHGDSVPGTVWGSYIRDIDPSSLLESTQSERDGKPTWWSPTELSWGDEQSAEDWLTSTHDLPAPESFIEVVDPSGKSWLTLEAVFSWAQPQTALEKETDTVRRSGFYILHGYLVPRADLPAALEWVRTADFYGRAFPEGPQGSGFYLGEFPKEPPFTSMMSAYHGRPGIQEVQDFGFKALVSWDQYYHETGFDCSIEESIVLDLPHPSIIEGMGARWRPEGADFVDPHGEVIAMDPSAHTRGPNAVLIRKEPFLQWLTHSDFGIVWALLGEKNLFSMRMDSPGSLIVSGGYWFNESTLVGAIRPRYMDFNRRRSVQD